MTDVGDIVKPVMTKVESIVVKNEPVFCDYIANNIKTEECCEEVDPCDDAVESSSHSFHKLETRNICSVTYNDEGHIEVEIKQEISPAVVEIEVPPFSRIGEVEIKDETEFSAYDDNITIEEWNPNLHNGMISKPPICKPIIDGETEQEQALRGVARQSVRAREHSHEHTDVSSTSHTGIDGDKVTHIRINHGEFNYCNVCMKCFSTTSARNAHMRVHTEEKPYKCDVCSKAFTRKSHLIPHMRLHTGEKPYTCSICMECFTCKSYYNTHLRMHHGEKPYKCDVCMKGFRSKAEYNRHMRIHTGEKPYKCDICMKSFSEKSACLKHMRIHTGEKPYKCDVCMKCFSGNSAYNKHMHIHTGEKPFKCEVCMKCFSVKSYYDKHMRIHTGEKPYKCNVCTKAFTQKAHLRTHMRIHTDEKPR